MTKEERSLLLYFETQAVDYGGSLESRRMNRGDFDIAKKWADEGLIQFGRIHSSCIKQGGARIATHWVILSEEAWSAAHKERRARRDRCYDKRRWITTEEGRG